MTAHFSFSKAAWGPQGFERIRPALRSCCGWRATAASRATHRRSAVMPLLKELRGRAKNPFADSDQCCPAFEIPYVETCEREKTRKQVCQSGTSLTWTERRATWRHLWCGGSCGRDCEELGADLGESRSAKGRSPGPDIEHLADFFLSPCGNGQRPLRHDGSSGSNAPYVLVARSPSCRARSCSAPLPVFAKSWRNLRHPHSALQRHWAVTLPASSTRLPFQRLSLPCRLSSASTWLRERWRR